MEAGRLNAYEVSPDAMKAMMAVEAYIASCGLEPGLVHLVKYRASQINGCAYCLDLHSREARSAGESENRLFVLDGWRETALFSERERAALAWTEALTGIAATQAPDSDYAWLRDQFTEKEAVDLTTAIALINAWNRLAIGLRYRPS